MNHKTSRLALITIITFITFSFLFISCSNSSNPLSPDETGLDVASGLTTHTYADTGNVLGAWTVHVFPDELKAEILPARNAATIGDIFDADLSQFLTVSPCANCLNVTNVFLDGYGDLCLTVKMKHPFDDLDSRPDLHGFDVRAIFITDQNDQLSYSDLKVMPPGGVEENATIGSPVLNVLNADGLTSHYDELVADSRYFIDGIDIPGNLNPFFRFFEDYGTADFDPHLPAGHNVMPVQSMNYARTAVFDISSLESDFTFYIVADVAYGHSATYHVRQNPQYYLPSFNRTEAWRVEYWIENNNLAYWDDTTSADVVVQVFDWQQGVTVDLDYPRPGHLDEIRETSDVAQVELSIPGLQDAPVTETIPESGTGTPADPLQYRLNVVNENGLGSSTCWGLLAVRDTLYGQASPSGRHPIPVLPAGFPYETLDIVDYASYLPVCVNIIGSYAVMFQTYLNVLNEMTVHKDDLFAKNGSTTLKPDFFMDPSHRKFTYEWDYDYDGVTFDVDDSDLPSDQLQYTEGGEYNIGFRVSTNSVPNQEYTYEIPVWSEGVSFHNTLENLSTIVDAASARSSHAVAVTSENFYVVFSNHEGADRTIWLSIGDKEGNFTTQLLAGATGFFADPCMLVIEGGVNEGIYIAYSDQNAGAEINTIKGNLDGTGFSSPVRISAGPTDLELLPVLVYFSNKLFCYYVHATLIESYIYGANSTDMGDSWTNDGWIVNTGGDDQYWPTAVAGGGSIYLLWQEDTLFLRNEIYMAESSDGFTFPDYDTAVGFVNNNEEIKPSVCYYNDQLAYTYLRYPVGLPDETNVVLGVYNTTSDSILTYPITTRNGLKHTYPTIGSASEGDFIVAYSAYDTAAQNLYQVVLNVDSAHAIGDFSEYVIVNEDTGSILPASAPNVFCGIASRAPMSGVSVAENFVVYTRFNNGNYDAGDSRVFGQLDRMGVYAERNFRYF